MNTTIRAITRPFGILHGQISFRLLRNSRPADHGRPGGSGEHIFEGQGKMRRLTAIGAILAAGLLAAACGTSSPSTGPSGAAGPHGTLTISDESGALWTCGFNPFNGNVSYLDFGPVYEPLVFVDSLASAKTTPWLASSFAWSNGNKTISFTIRQGVKWNDGQPMSAADVAFTFNLLKKFPGLDINSVWSVLSSVTQQGNTVVMNFKAPAVPYFYYIADQVPIVPEHIWSKIANPVTFNDPSPVATGAYTVTCKPEQITFLANKHYWQPGLPKIAQVNEPAFTSNDPANTYLATGQAQWGSQYIPSIKTFYTDKSPSYHYWFPPYANVSIFINQKDPILSNVAVRQAMAYAIDRNKVSQIGESGYEPAGNQTGIVTPTFSSWLDTAAASQYNYTYNPAKAISILEKAGFKKNSSGIFQTPSGKPLSFNVINEGGFSDWVASMQVIQTELKAVGIKITPQNLAGTAFNTALYNGQFQLAYFDETGGPTPYYEMRQWLYSANSAPIGKQASTNWERYSNPAVDKLINEYGTTTSATTQHQIVNQLEQVMLKDVPLIPVTESVDWYQYDTSSFSGWATPSDPFAQPAAYSTPDLGIMLLHLKPNK
jgi:peptide/nickel transport system substrate-binding protein